MPVTQQELVSSCPKQYQAPKLTLKPSLQATVVQNTLAWSTSCADKVYLTDAYVANVLPPCSFPPILNIVKVIGTQTRIVECAVVAMLQGFSCCIGKTWMS